MRYLTFHQRRPLEQVAERRAFLLGLPDGDRLPPGPARFILAVARQYENQGVTWQELVAAAYAGWRSAQAHPPGASGQIETLGAWRVRQHMLEAIAFRAEVNATDHTTSARGRD